MPPGAVERVGGVRRESVLSDLIAVASALLRLLGCVVVVLAEGPEVRRVEGEDWIALVRDAVIDDGGVLMPAAPAERGAAAGPLAAPAIPIEGGEPESLPALGGIGPVCYGPPRD